MLRGTLLACVIVVSVSCGGGAERPPQAPGAQTGATMHPATEMHETTFEDDLGFLRGHGPVIVLASGDGGRLAVSPKYQGRVMTSAVGPGARSLGWTNRPFIEAGRTGTPFDNYGGEDRFWLGPEGGQFGLYFAPGAPYTFANWQTPADLNEGPWTVASEEPRRVVMRRQMRVTNHGGAVFSVAVERTVSLLTADDAGTRLGVRVPPSLRVVAYESDNRITNTGQGAWTRDRGLLSIWILGMYAPSRDAHVVIPFDAAASGDLVNDRYFGKVPPERLAVRDREGVLVFTCDGEKRSKIGLGPARAKNVLGSYSEAARLLTIVQYDKPRSPAPEAYVNSMWEDQKDPFGGDVVNSYNDGPTEPGKPSLGGFYEIETSSPAAALGPNESTHHAHRTFHFVGERADLDPLARAVLGIGLDALPR